LAYCPRGNEVTQRLRRLFEQRALDLVLATMEVPSRALAAFAAQHVGGYCDDPDLDERVRFWDGYLSEKAGVCDDSIPSAYLSEMDQGLYGGLVGGEVRFLCDPATGWISSMVPPILKDWSELEHLAIRGEGPWLARYLRQLDVFVEAARGRFVILISGLNFVFELVGAMHTYVALYDRPEMVRRAVELARQLNVKVHQTFFERVRLLEGGTCSNMVQWMPGRIVSESVDPFHMTSVDCFERWGRENLEQIFAHFDGGVVHLHANGRHLLDAVSTVRGLKAILLADDRDFPPAFEFLPQARPRVGDLPLVVGVGFDRFREALERHELTGGVLYRVSGAPDVETANRCLEQVRDYRATV
jgi:hypothetical protein